MPRPLEACPACGGGVRHIERTNDRTPNDHHNNVYVCGECGRETLAG